jgi:hypothetical protein
MKKSITLCLLILMILLFISEYSQKSNISSIKYINNLHIRNPLIDENIDRLIDKIDKEIASINERMKKKSYQNPMPGDQYPIYIPIIPEQVDRFQKDENRVTELFRVTELLTKKLKLMDLKTNKKSSFSVDLLYDPSPFENYPEYIPINP